MCKENPQGGRAEGPGQPGPDPNGSVLFHGEQEDKAACRVFKMQKTAFLNFKGQERGGLHPPSVPARMTRACICPMITHADTMSNSAHMFLIPIDLPHKATRLEDHDLHVDNEHGDTYHSPKVEWLIKSQSL